MLKSAYLWVQESTLRTFVGGLVIVFIVGAGARLTHAATSQDVSNEVQMNLDVSINSTQTTGIILSAPQLNGSNWTFASTTGGVLRVRYGQYREDLHYTSATVDSTSKKVTLVGVTRAICSQVARSYTSCSNGRAWGKGSIVELTVDARLLNLKMNLDRANTTVGSGSILCGSTVNPCMFQGRYTTAQRDAFTWKGGAGQGTPIIHNTTSGTLQWWDGASWVEIGDTGTANATESVPGKVELGTLADQSGATLLGGSTASTVVQTQYLTGTGGRAWRIPYTAKTGILTGSLLGTGNKNVNSGRTHVSGTGAWVADPSVGSVFFSCRSATGSILLTGTVAETTLKQCNFTGSLIADGDVFGVDYTFYQTNLGGSASFTPKIKIGSTTFLTFASAATIDSTPATYSGIAYFRFRTSGSTAQIIADGKFESTSTGATTISRVHAGSSPLNPVMIYDMTTNPSLSITATLANTTVGNSVRLTSFNIWKYSNATQIRP